MIREPVGLWRWAAILLGFVGVVAILGPGTDAFSYLTLLPIGSAAFWDLMECGDAGESPQQDAHRIAYDPLRAVTIATETFNHPLVIAPAEMGDMIELVLQSGAGDHDALRSILRMLDKKGMKEDAGKSMANLGISTVQNMGQAVETLSGGQRQAVAVARAATFATKFVVLDEPTVALAVNEVRKVLEFVRQIKQNGHACVYIEHNLAHVHEVADRLIVMDRGEIVAEIRPPDMSVPELTEFLIDLQRD